jgi:hypothetical protein
VEVYGTEQIYASAPKHRRLAPPQPLSYQYRLRFRESPPVGFMWTL